MSRRQQNTSIAAGCGQGVIVGANSIAGLPSSTDNGRHVLVFQQKDVSGRILNS